MAESNETNVYMVEQVELSSESSASEIDDVFDLQEI